MLSSKCLDFCHFLNNKSHEMLLFVLLFVGNLSLLSMPNELIVSFVSFYRKRNFNKICIKLMPGYSTRDSKQFQRKGCCETLSSFNFFFFFIYMSCLWWFCWLKWYFSILKGLNTWMSECLNDWMFHFDLMIVVAVVVFSIVFFLFKTTATTKNEFKQMVLNFHIKKVVDDCQT